MNEIEKQTHYSNSNRNSRFYTVSVFRPFFTFLHLHEKVRAFLSAAFLYMYTKY